MGEYRGWLFERFPRLNVVQCDPARDWPDVESAMARFSETKPRLALISAGWYAACLVGAAKATGAVAIDYGHCPEYHLGGAMQPNTCCPRGPDGCQQHYAHGNFPDAIHQMREIEFPWRAA
jgi:hypothetical protein